ncbi:CGNR zinc finger domain-containing protein [Streptomyces sp. H39-S7]|uniref:CGNR zinc finger domain-containing protein n=1 Tax=Streptomyces sp. H39-S7 TaxID=3004357 RepID=UPI0022AF6E5D|nr:CGNR zinc finger domain-containing protein [Streptomyces sp. H39-S7]MCZ4119899.1 CGNR zinc finger domain-containing protein [Streptomyces sp. H39-S7]
MKPTTVAAEVEELRHFLNTLSIPNDTRALTDALPALTADVMSWQRLFGRISAPHGRKAGAELARLRDDLRADVEERGSGRLDGWLSRYPQTARIEEGALVLSGADTPVEEILRLAAWLVTDRRWSRLRACPDCRWVFYDQSRNNSRVWCSMYAGSTGRACGSIAKVTAMRSRRSAAAGS